MAKKKTEGEETKGNFQNFEALALEFKKGKMPERKLIALRKKLVSHYKDSSITEEEQALMESILRKERLQRKITSADKYLLNAIESERCEEVAMVKTSDVPSVLHLKKDLECRFRFDEDYDDGKNKPDSVGRYHVYVPRTIPTRHQLKVSTVLKEGLGHPTDDSEYPKDKIVIHHIILKVKEFNKWFDVQDPSILDGDAQQAQDEKEFQF